MPSEVIRTRKVLPKTLLPTVLRRLFFFVFWIYAKEKEGLGLSLTDGRKKDWCLQRDVFGNWENLKKNFCTIFFNLQKAFMPPINKEFSEVLSNHFNKSVILKIPHAIGLWSNVHFLAPNHFGWCNYFLGFFSFPLNCSLQFSAPQD